jgi:hypothetical protein
MIIGDDSCAKAHIKAIEAKAGKYSAVGAAVVVVLWSVFVQGWQPLAAAMEWLVFFCVGFGAIRASEINKLKELAIVRAAGEKRAS